MEFKNHAASVHEVNMPFKCEVREYDLSRILEFKNYAASVHVVNKPFKCEVCYQRLK